jgi:predicted lipoprotein with Yx(FWY)xxD motif
MEHVRPNPVRTLATALVVAAGASVVLAPNASAAKSPVSTINANGFGTVLTTPSRQALYVFNQEKDGKVRCTGACKAAWPVLYAPKDGRVSATLKGFKGTFATVRRPDDKRLQVTWNGRPLYTYAHEGPGQVRCNNAGGWFVVRATGKIF